MIPNEYDYMQQEFCKKSLKDKEFLDKHIEIERILNTLNVVVLIILFSFFFANTYMLQGMVHTFQKPLQFQIQPLPYPNLIIHILKKRNTVLFFSLLNTAHFCAPPVNNQSPELNSTSFSQSMLPSSLQKL